MLRRSHMLAAGCVIVVAVACSSSPEAPERQVLETPKKEDEEVIEPQLWDDDPAVHFARVEEEFEAWTAMTIEGTEEEQQEAMSQMLAGFQVLVVEYNELFEHGEATSTTAGLYRIGDMMARMAEAIIEAPIPFEEGTEEYREHREERREEAATLEERAFDHWEEMLWSAGQQGLETEWIGEALEEVKRYDSEVVDAWLVVFPERVEFAAAQYKKRCEEGKGWACGALARMYRDEERLGDDPRAALKLYRSACDLDAEECLDLGMMYAAGEGVDADEERAEELFDLACDAGRVDACERLR